MKYSTVPAIRFIQGMSMMAILALLVAGAQGQTCLDLECPSNVVTYMPCGSDCVTISNYPPAFATNHCSPADLVVSYNPPPGHCFPFGTTPVVVTASGSGQTNSCSFSVTVLANPGCTSLPVYSVVQSGALGPQAAALAGSLGIPANAFILTNGQMDFLDPTNFMAAPVAPVTDPTVQSNLLADTVNKFPGIPIRFEQLDFAALNALTVPGSNAAVLSFATGLTNAGLAPQSAIPIVTHTILTAFYTNDNNVVLSASNRLDTEVSYQMTLQGLPVVGPGAQVQVAYGPNGAVTRLRYAARLLAAGPMVNVIPPTVASNMAAAMYGGINGQITLQLVYYAPPLSLTTVSNLIPWYLCGATTLVTNPATGQITTAHLMRALIPATDNANFVPSLQMSAFATGGGTQVVASATVTGGTPPYTYLWSGSEPELFTNTGPRIQYIPVIQATPTEISITPATSGSVMLSWPDPSSFYQIESTLNLGLPSWTILSNNVAQSNGINSVTVNTTSQAQFFRLVLTNQPAPATETIGLKIMDKNGVYVGTRQNLGIAVIPVLKIQGEGSPPSINWGTESPYDEDIGDWDTASWRSTMQNFATIFGSEQFDRGEYIAHPLDFIESRLGWDEMVMDTAAITLYVGHGNPNGISFTDGYTGPSQPGRWLNNSDPILAHSWGNDQEEWMALLSCQVLAQVDDPNPDYLAFERWGPAFDGLHMMLGFETDAASGSITGIGGDSFETVFIKGMAGKAGKPGWTLTLQQAWFHAALTTGPLWQSGGVGDPAVLGPIGAGGVWDFGDFWWGMGSVGPRIKASNIKGWFYIYAQQ